MTKNNVKNIAARGLAGALTLAALLTLVQVPGMVSAAAGPERSLAGIHIFDPGSQVTAKFGNPSRILVGGVAPGAFSAGGSSSGGYGSGGPAGGQGPQGMSSSQPGQGQRAGAGLLPGFSGVPMSSSGAGGGFPGAGGGFPGAGGGEFPGAPGGGGAMAMPGINSMTFPGAPGGGVGTAVLPPKEAVTLIYDRQNGG